MEWQQNRVYANFSNYTTSPTYPEGRTGSVSSSQGSNYGSRDDGYKAKDYGQGTSSRPLPIPHPNGK